MSTSLLDYVFRNDLAHVEPDDILPDTLGRGHQEGDLPDTYTAALVTRATSVGYMRSKLRIVQGGAEAGNGAGNGTGNGAGNGAKVTAFAGVLAAETAATGGAAAAVMEPRFEQIREAHLKGYEGDSCSECGNFTLVRNGTCEKCDTCGATSGCS